MERLSPKGKIQVYVPLSLKHEVERRADIAGQTLSTWVERALRRFIATLGDTLVSENQNSRRF